MLFVAWREAVVAARNNVVQLVQGVAARTPRFPFLVSDEQVVVTVEGERVGHADACRDGFESLRFHQPFLNRAARAIEVVMRNSVLQSIRVRVIVRYQTDITGVGSDVLYLGL